MSFFLLSSFLFSPKGKRVRLKGFQGFLGGLDNEKDMTGEFSVSTKFAGLEVMFHVAPLMPFDPNDPQQVTNNIDIPITSVYSNGPLHMYTCIYKHTPYVYSTYGVCVCVCTYAFLKRIIIIDEISMV